MKKTTIVTRIATLAFIVMLTLGFTSSASASPVTGDPVEFKFIGNHKNNPVLQLNLNNVEKGEFVITIKDRTRSTLYTENVNGYNVTRNYRLDIDEMDASELYFEVLNAKTNTSSTYKITRNIRTVQDTIVDKL